MHENVGFMASDSVSPNAFRLPGVGGGGDHHGVFCRRNASCRKLGSATLEANLQYKRRYWNFAFVDLMHTHIL